MNENSGIGHSDGTIDLYTMYYKSPVMPTPYKSAEIKLWTNESKESVQALVDALQFYTDRTNGVWVSEQQ